jgi:molybdate transport system substrate-binding protein
MKRIALLILLIAALLSACVSVTMPTPAQAATASALTATQQVPVLQPTLLPSTNAPAPEPRTLTVFAAASLKDAFTEIGRNFESFSPGVSVALNFAGSKTLSTQLTQGASADVFASANKTEMDKVVAANLIAVETPQNFLTNSLVVILPPANPAGLKVLADLAKSGLKLVLAADTVPAGKYSLQVLDKLSADAAFGADFKTKVLANVVSYENDVKQVVAKVQLGEADAGIVYLSDSVSAPDMQTIQIPANLNVVAKYPIAALSNAPQPELAAAFVAYVLSADGQSILKKWGFAPSIP